MIYDCSIFPFQNEGKASYVVVCSILIGNVANSKYTQQEHKSQTTNQISLHRVDRRTSWQVFNLCVTSWTEPRKSLVSSQSEALMWMIAVTTPALPLVWRGNKNNIL